MTEKDRAHPVQRLELRTGRKLNHVGVDRLCLLPPDLLGNQCTSSLKLNIEGLAAEPVLVPRDPNIETLVERQQTAACIVPQHREAGWHPAGPQRLLEEPSWRAGAEKLAIGASGGAGRGGCGCADDDGRDVFGGGDGVGGGVGGAVVGG